jgi:hypothetical protein
MRRMGAPDPRALPGKVVALSKSKEGTPEPDPRFSNQLISTCTTPGAARSAPAICGLTW